MMRDMLNAVRGKDIRSSAIVVYFTSTINSN
jgi:hypothetical protein